MASPLPPHVARFREQYRAREISRYYSGWGHFLLTSTAALAAIAFAATRVHHVRPHEWLTIPLAFLTANLGEYLGHRGPMHRARPGLWLLYQRHTRQHHHFYTHDAMAAGSSTDFKMVLFPPVMLLFFLGGIATPLGALLFFIASANIAWLFVATVTAYFLTYEWLHFCYHQGEGSWVGRLPFMAVLRRHHITHHDLALMGRWNFNITFPISDWLFRTYHQ